MARKVVRNVGGEPQSGPALSETKPAARFSPLDDPARFRKALESWDPDQDKDIVPRTIAIGELYERVKIRKMHQRVGGAWRPNADHRVNRISGNMIFESGVRDIVDPQGNLVEQVRVQSGTRFSDWSGLNRLRESKQMNARILREVHGRDLSRESALARFVEGLRKGGLKENFPNSFLYGEDGDMGTSVGPNDEYTPLLLGPYNRNLYMQDFNDQASKGFEAYNHNPVAKALALLMLHFPIGDGITVNFANPLCQKIWDDFVVRVDWHNQIRKLAVELTVIGEGWIYDPLDEPAGMELLDATTVWEIVTNPRRITDVYYAYRQFPTQYQLLLGSDKLAGPAPPAQEYVIESLAPQDWLQIRANSTVGEKRGRGDFYPCLGWFKRFKDWFNAAVISGQINNAFVIWWKVNGSDADVKSLQGNADFTTLPPPGSAWFTNEQVVPTLLRPQGGVRADDQTGVQLLSIIAASMNIPPEYLGVESTANRATSLTRAEPGWKTFECRQQLFREIVTWQVKRVLMKARRDGLLPQRQPSAGNVRTMTRAAMSGDWNAVRRQVDAMSSGGTLDEPIDMEFEISMAQLQPEERSLRIKDLGAGLVSGYISHETAALDYYKTMQMQRIDYREEQEKRREEQESGVLVPLTVPADDGMDAGGQGEDGFDDDGGAPRDGSTADVANYKADNQDRPRR